MTSLDTAIATMRQALAYHVDAAERIRRALAELEDLDSRRRPASTATPTPSHHGRQPGPTAHAPAG